MDLPLKETRYYAVGNFGMGGRRLPGRRTLIVKARDKKTGLWSHTRLRDDGEKLANFLGSILSPIGLEALHNTLHGFVSEHDSATTS